MRFENLATALFLVTASSSSSVLGFTLPVGAFTSTSSKSTSSSNALFAATLSTQENAVSQKEEGTAAVDSMIGMREDDLFQCDDSVEYWKQFESMGNEKNVESMREILSRQQLLPSLTDNDKQQSLARAYWASHLFRSSYFSVNAALGSIASDLHERLIAKDSKNGDAEKQESASPILSAGGSMVTRLLDSDIPTRLVLETLKTYEQDYEWVASGVLKYPWDAVVQHDGDVLASSSSPNRLQLSHRQANPLFVLSETAKAVRESVGIFSRRNKGGSKGVWQQGSTKSSNIYPDYYLNDFHYQTDGWLSTTSAERYESSTETLFLGRQDAMQRQTLVPLIKKQRKSNPNKEPMSILEVACGTGRFGTFVRDNFPESNLTMTDLSPYYLEKARENDKYWRSFRKEQTKKDAPDTTSFVQANAEDLPFPSNSFDAVLCVYLFHELPAEARRRAAAEMVRVVKPGGTIVLTDSMQIGDRPKMLTIANFAKLNEPHFENYVTEGYLPELFSGCDCGEKYMASSTKTVSFTKKE